MISKLSLTTMALAAVLTVTNVSAQPWTSAYTSPTATGDCSALPAALNTGFTTTPVVSRAKFADVANIRIIKMAFWLQPGATFNDIYMVEKGTGGTARVLYYNAVDSSLKVIGTLTGVNFGGGGVDEQGLLGIALNPVTFGTDNYLYLNYAVGASAGEASPTNGWRTSRFTLDPVTKMIDLTSEKVLLTVPASHNGRWHTGGALSMDNFGNLYISTGDNEALATGAGNTADLRGAILRIKPDNSTQGYSIPAGNFGEYWAQKWQDSGLTARAAKYRDPTKVRPEIYVKGSRNAYAMSVDRYRLGWLQWGECGPDAQRSEEHNLTKTPAFSGWPFWAGDTARQTAKASSYGETPDVGTGAAWTAFNPNNMPTTIPVNNFAGIAGVDTLPPMHIPAYTYKSPSCAAGGGPIIRYDARVSNPYKMPPHLNNVSMFSDFTVTNTNSIYAKAFDSATAGSPGAPTAGTNVFTMAKTGRPNTSNPVDFQQGADGSLYMIDWGTGCCSSGSSATQNGIVRITYNGTCRDTALNPGTTSLRSIVHRGSVDWLRIGMNEIRVSADGDHSVKILDLNGRSIGSFNGNGSHRYAMPASMTAGKLYVLRVETELGTAVRTLSRF